MSQPSAEFAARPTPHRPPGGRGGCELLFGLGWTGFSLIFVILPIAIFIVEWQTAHLLRTTGVTTEAVVVSRRIDEDSEGDTYYVTYRYRVPLKGDQLALTHEESVGHDLYHELPPESTLLVRYSAADPTLVRLEGRSRTLEIILLSCMMSMGALFTAIGAWLVYSSGQGIYRARLLARRGQLTVGRVTHCWIKTDSDGDRDYCVGYRFAPPGAPEVITAEYNRKAFDALQVGQPVQVQYVPGRPEICRLEL